MNESSFTRTFHAGIDPFNNVLGWAPTSVPLFEPRYYLHPFGVAHDSMEHPERIDATLKNELMAHGAALYVRPSAELPKQLQANLAWFYAQVHAGKFPDAPMRLEGLSYAPSLELGDVIYDIVSKLGLSRIEWKTVAAWMVEGYLGARWRYRGIERLQLAAMFRNVQEAVTTIGTQVPIGQRLDVHIDYSNATTAVQLV